ncbi:circularly permuted type 2 ATP-grasp protein [Pseudocolwellia sp. AS88]|uniref:circularly permuted type 2 ATP-grasp protein n=1 Tax=Pseudocolwellia sp. AS88 TaxID=3063958 RepID=UPI0026EF135B|nr:circularly permuted type 2 ATP-grasp protein [Pseudocolwellia sp. AS88]MDO7085162.1 circularly permuted type 2 ATP-grasp protein [Pseudocolwellia sp. AS88]
MHEIKIITFRYNDKAEREYVLENITNMAVKPADESGCYGILIGPHASRLSIINLKTHYRSPRNYSSATNVKPLLTTPTMGNTCLQSRHLNLRFFILSGKDIKATMGGWIA